MPLQILTLKLDGITAGDYLTWCRDPDPPALELALLSVAIDADPLAETVTAILDWNESPPPASAAASAAGLPLPAGAQLHAFLTEASQTSPVSTAAGHWLSSIPAPVAPAATNRPRVAGPSPAAVGEPLRTAT
jgi:hypothetical protein